MMGWLRRIFGRKPEPRIVVHMHVPTLNIDAERYRAVIRNHIADIKLRRASELFAEAIIQALSE